MTRFREKRRQRAMVAAAVSVALVLTGSLAGEVAVAGDGGENTQAEAANHKRCKQRCKRRRARRFIGNHSYSRGAQSPYGGGYSERFVFCRSGTYSFRGRYQNPGFLPWTDTYNGTWFVKRAFRNVAIVHYTSSNFRSVYDGGFQGPSSPPPASGDIRFTAYGQTVMYIGSSSFTRGPGC